MVTPVQCSKILLLDGYNLAFRSYYALPDLTRSDGFPTGGLHGWLKTLWKLEDMENPAGIVVFFDEEGSDRHQALLPDYKANRTEMPEPLAQQIPVMKSMTELLGWPVVSRPGIEADDLIASAASRLADEGNSVVIVSADKDLGQCVTAQVNQLLPAPTANPRLGWRRLDPGGVLEKFGVEPARVPDYLALIGDTSDNIPGLAGVGPKTAVKWLNAHGTLEDVINHAHELTPPRFQEIVTSQAERLRLNLKLVTLERHHEIGPITKKPPQASELSALLESMEMKNAAAQAWERLGLGLS